MTVTRVARARATKTTRGTVLFADLRGYTALAERLAPARIVPLLDEFFGVLAAATASHGGQVFHMAGDGMMAGFGVGSAQDGAREAFAPATSFCRISRTWRRAGAGNSPSRPASASDCTWARWRSASLGPPGHKRTTLVGDTVNVAARLCGRARAGESCSRVPWRGARRGARG